MEITLKDIKITLLAEQLIRTLDVLVKNKTTYALRRHAGFGRLDIIRTQNPDSIHN